MTKLLFRQDESVPERKYEGREYKNYRTYKPFLRNDFKKKLAFNSGGQQKNSILLLQVYLYSHYQIA